MQGIVALLSVRYKQVSSNFTCGTCQRMKNIVSVLTKAFRKQFLILPAHLQNTIYMFCYMRRMSVSHRKPFQHVI